MGLTFVAAGVSVPDALSSLAVIKEGLGDMAVSNAVGSNVFDILVCLGLPWFIQTAMIQPGSHVNVTSRGTYFVTTWNRQNEKVIGKSLLKPRVLKFPVVWVYLCVCVLHASLEYIMHKLKINHWMTGLTYSTLSLLSTVVFLVVATHMNGWKLDRRYGMVLMIWYLIFIVFASLYELNLFGQMNPETCPSLY